MAKVEQAANVNLVSRISAGTYFKGEIISPNDLRIDGRFDGSIISDGKVVVGESAEVNAKIVCVNADVWGKTKGSFTVKDIMSIKSDCSVEGELRVRRLVVELGASFNNTRTLQGRWPARSSRRSSMRLHSLRRNRVK